MKENLYSYTITVNAQNREDLDTVIKEMTDHRVTPQIVSMHKCFGPFEQDGSFIALFASHSNCGDYVSEWGGAKKFLRALAKELPDCKFTLKVKNVGAAEPTIDRWNAGRMRCRLRDAVAE